MNILEWYKNTSWHKWWMKNVWQPSWSKLTTAVYGIPSALVVIGQYASNFLQDNTIQSYLSYMDIPNWVPMTLAGIALVHYMASEHK